MLPLLASLLAGCTWYTGSKKGEQNQLSFFEPNEYPGDTVSAPAGFERPLALGARVDAWVLGGGLSTILSAQSDDPDIVSATLVGSPIVLRARAEGTTTLRVRTSSTEDALPLTVLAPDSARLWIPEPSTSLSFAPTDAYFGTGIALRPGARINVAAEPHRGTTKLLGFGLFQWKVEPASLDLLEVGINQVRATANGTAGMAKISTQLGSASIEVATLAASEVPTLRFYSVANNLTMPPEVAAIAPQDLAGIALAGTDATGRVVRPGPNDDAMLNVTVLAGSVRVLSTKMSGHYLTLTACTGTGTIRIDYLGGTRELPIEVTADVADKACQ